MKSSLAAKRLLSFFNIPRCLPHLLLFVIGVNRNAIQLDIKRAALHHGIVVKFPLIDLLYLLTFDRFFRNLFYYRIGNLSYLFSWLLPRHNSYVISSTTKIEAPFLGVHPIGTTINAVSIGSGFICRNNTVIGIGRGGLPTIGKNVDVGTNSVIIGGIIIGDNVKIGAGSVVTKSIPDNCTVVGNPAIILKENGLRVDRRV